MAMLGFAILAGGSEPCPDGSDDDDSVPSGVCLDAMTQYDTCYGTYDGDYYDDCVLWLLAENANLETAHDPEVNSATPNECWERLQDIMSCKYTLSCEQLDAWDPASIDSPCRSEIDAYYGWITQNGMDMNGECPGVPM